MFGLSIGILAVGLCCIVIFFAWGIDNYYVWDRTNNVYVNEFQPAVTYKLWLCVCACFLCVAWARLQTVAKAVGILYAYDRFASILRVDWLLQAQTKACGVIFKEHLGSEE